jgi:hypothetical protein
MPADLFLPPSGFTKYDTAEGLVNEFAARQQNLKQRPTYKTQDWDAGSGHEGRTPTRPE